MNYIYATQREGGLLDIKAWYKGESDYLKELIGAGFYHTIYLCEDGIVKFYCREDEIKEFEKALEQVDEKEFNNICDDFLILCGKIPDCRTDEEKLELFAQMIPALTIFFEFDEYPEYMDDFSTFKRLLRVREATESKSYELLYGVGDNEPKDFILYKGEVYLK